MTDAQVIAECRDYDELVAALRKRLTELGVTLETIDAISGLPSRYVQKLLCVRPVKKLGRISLGPVLGALGLKIILATDVETLEKIRSRLAPYENAGTSMRALGTRKKRAFTLFQRSPELARIARQRQLLRMSPEARRRAARHAANARWGKRRKSPAMP